MKNIPTLDETRVDGLLYDKSLDGAISNFGHFNEFYSNFESTQLIDFLWKITNS